QNPNCASAAEKTPEGSGPFLRQSCRANLVAAANATGYGSAIPMDLRDLHGAMTASIRTADVDRHTRTVVATPIVVMPATILSGCRRCNRKQRQRCQCDKSSLHCVLLLVMSDKRASCCGVPKQSKKSAEQLFRVANIRYR